VEDRTGLGVEPLEEVDQRPGAVRRERQLPERIVGAVEQFGHRRQQLKLLEDGQQIVTLGMGGMGVEIDGQAVLGLLQPTPTRPGRRPGEERRLQEPVVLQEAHENAGQHPGRRGLGDLRLAPGDKMLGGAVGGLGLGVFGLEVGLALRPGLAVVQDIPFQFGQQGLEIGEEALGVDHGGQAATSTYSTWLLGAGGVIPSSRIPSKWKAMASLISSATSSTVSPVAMQPGRSGT
jgi:hypothetical protein